MNKEKFLAKGVARKYEKGEVLFNVESLHEHYEGINYHLTDILEGGFIRPNDVLDGDIREIEVVVEEIPTEEWETPIIEVEVTQEMLDDNPQLVAEGIEVGEILTVDATEEIEVVDEVIVAETPEE